MYHKRPTRNLVRLAQPTSEHEPRTRPPSARTRCMSFEPPPPTEKLAMEPGSAPADNLVSARPAHDRRQREPGSRVSNRRDLRQTREPGSKPEPGSAPWFNP